MNDKELKQLAMDIAEDRVFGTWQIDQYKNIPLVFMPLVFMKEDEAKDFLDKHAQIYEYIHEAGPRAINGQPMFFSMKGITLEDWEKIVPMVGEIFEFKNKFVSK